MNLPSASKTKMAGWSFLSLWPSWITYKLPALSNATSCVVCHEYFAGNCGQLCSASYLYSPLPRMTAESVFLAVRIAGTAATAAAPAATFKNSRRRIADDMCDISIKCGKVHYGRGSAVRGKVDPNLLLLALCFSSRLHLRCGLGFICRFFLSDCCCCFWLPLFLG